MTLPSLAMPASLPPWQVGSYALEEAAMYGHAVMSTGHSRTRRLYNAAEATHTATMRVSQSQLADFYEWFEGDLQAGLLPFAALVADPLQGTAWFECLFLEPYTAATQGNGVTMLTCKLLVRGQGQQAGPADMIADFATVHPWPALSSKLGFAQNLKDDTLVAAVPYMVELGVTGFFGNLELDGWFKNGASPIPWCNCTYNGAGRAIAMTGVPAAVATTMVSTLIAAGIRPGVQITGATPPYQPATTGYKRRHPAPAPGDIAADGAIVAQYTDQTYWGGAGILWSHLNEPGRTQFDCAKGFDIDNTPITETQAQYETRRKGLKLQALYATRDTFKARASKATYNIGIDSAWCLASILAGDTRSSNGRTVPDGRTFRDALFDEYDANIKTDATVTPITYVTSNDFASRSSVISGSVSDFNGADYPLIFTQGGPALFKVALDDDGGDDQDPAPDTHMGPACQMATMMLGEWETPAVAQRHWSYMVGGQDAFLSADGLGGYIKRHRFTAVKLLTSVPTRRVMLSAVKQSPSGDADAYGQQGLIGFAGIDPGGQTAAVCVWNETTTAKTITLAPRNLPVALQDAAAQHTTLDEATPLGSTTGWAGEPITLQPRTMHLITWAAGTSLQLRRQPLQTPSVTPRFLSRVDTYKRPKGACGYFDQVRGVAWLCPSSTSSTKITTGAAWDGLPDSIWLTFYAHNIDAASAPLTVTVNYGAGTVTLLSTTVGAVVPGAPVQINLLASAPGGWAAGARRAQILVATQNASDQRVECWFSGTLAKAQEVAQGVAA